MGVLQVFPDKYEAIDQHVVDTFKKYIGRGSYVKSDLSETVSAWSHVTGQHVLISELLKENIQLCQKVMDRDAQVMKP